MFYPRAMTEIELIVPSRDLLAVTKTLSSYGVFHQAEQRPPAPGSQQWFRICQYLAGEGCCLCHAGTPDPVHHADVEC